MIQPPLSVLPVPLGALVGTLARARRLQPPRGEYDLDTEAAEKTRELRLSMARAGSDRWTLTPPSSE